MQANKKIESLRSELNHSKKLADQFKETAETAKKHKENLLEEYKSKENTKKSITMKLEKLQDNLNYCNMELEKKFKRIIPNFKVSCYS